MRTRIAELVASGGLPQGVLSMQALYLLPQEFVVQYQALFSRSLAEESLRQSKTPDAATGEFEGPVPRPGPQIRTSARSKPQIGGVQGAPKRVQRHWFVRDPAAFEFKKRIDRKLRALAREMQTHSGGGRGVESRSIPNCGQCGRFLEPTWQFCAYCGNRLT